MKPERILIAYKEDIWARPLDTFFQELGYTVEMVTVVSQMVQRVLNGDIYVLLLDDDVEGRKAYELVSLLKGVNRRIQAIVVSSQESLGVVRQLRSAGIFYQAMSENKFLKVFIASGYFDLDTSYFATKYTVNHLSLDPSLRNNITLAYYDAGHQMYTHLPSLRKLTADVTEFYTKALPFP